MSWIATISWTITGNYPKDTTLPSVASSFSSSDQFFSTSQVSSLTDTSQGALNICSSYALQSILNFIQTKINKTTPFYISNLTIIYTVGQGTNLNIPSCTIPQTTFNPDTPVPTYSESLTNNGTYSSSISGTSASLNLTSVSGTTFTDVLTQNENEMLQTMYNYYLENPSITSLSVTEKINIENIAVPQYGSTWIPNTKFSSPNNPIRLNAINSISVNYSSTPAIGSGQYQCCTTPEAVYLSKDNGNSWNTLATDNLSPPTYFLNSGMSPDGSIIQLVYTTNFSEVNGSSIYTYNTSTMTSTTNQTFPYAIFGLAFSNTTNYCTNPVSSPSPSIYFYNGTSWSPYTTPNSYVSNATFIQVCDTGTINNTKTGTILISYINDNKSCGILVSNNSGATYKNYSNSCFNFSYFSLYYLVYNICMSQDGSYQYVLSWANDNLSLYYVTNGTEPNAWANPLGPVLISSIRPNSQSSPNIICDSTGQYLTVLVNNTNNKFSSYIMYSTDYGLHWGPATPNNFNGPTTIYISNELSGDSSGYYQVLVTPNSNYTKSIVWQSYQ